jgi:seryl-tRNA synthetase
MIDLKKLREHPEQVFEAVKKKDPAFDVQALYSLDLSWRKISQEVESLRSAKNDVAAQAKRGVTDELREKSLRIGHELKIKEKELTEIYSSLHTLALECPNPADPSVPAGGKEANYVWKVEGEQPTFAFPIRNHLELGTALGWIDFEGGARVAGSQFVVYRSQAVRLIYALTRLMLNNNISFGYEPIFPPAVVNETSLTVTGNFPKFKDQVYDIKNDDLFLSPTSEVSLTNLYRDSILEHEQLPIRMTAWTSCFRREAGGYGATERGLIRMHQFEKVELVSLCPPEYSAQEQERMIACVENILQQLNLHYRITLLAGQDCSFSSAKTYDVEVWSPGQNCFLEASSISNCLDFQARRGMIRYKQGNKTQHVHTLNGSSLALSRIMVALMETYQNEDGTITLPEVLNHYYPW